jgi:SAM-dependent methyltransferase
MPNVEQVEYWDGSGGEHWVAQQARYDQINGAFGDRVVEVLSPRPGERVLDVGCGNGALSLAIGPLVAPDGSVLGLDISGPMLAMATIRAGRFDSTNKAPSTSSKTRSHNHPCPRKRVNSTASSAYRARALRRRRPKPRRTARSSDRFGSWG